MKTKTIISTKYFLVISLLSVSFTSIAEKIAEIEIPEPDKFSSQLTLQKNKSHMKLIKDVRKYLEVNNINILNKKKLEDNSIIFSYIDSFNDNINKTGQPFKIRFSIIALMRYILDRIHTSLTIDYLNDSITQSKNVLILLTKDKKLHDLTNEELFGFTQVVQHIKKIVPIVTELRRKRAEVKDIEILKTIEQLEEDITADKWHKLVLDNLQVDI